jgi:hypothetical protein
MVPTSKTRATLRLLEKLAPTPDPDIEATMWFKSLVRYGLAHVRMAPCYEGPAPAPHLRPTLPL